MWKDLAFLLFFLAEVGLHVSLSQQEPAFTLVVPIFGTVAYSLWRRSYVPTFVAGLLSGWSFYTAVSLWYLLGSSYPVSLPLEGFLFFTGTGVVYGMLGLITVWIRLSTSATS